MPLLVVAIKLKWKYLNKTVAGVGTLMGTLKESLRMTLFPALFGGGGWVDAEFKKIIDHSVKCGGLGIPDRR